MYIRETLTKNRKTKKQYTKHQLVESYRTEKGPRQRVVMNLGSLVLPKAEWKKLAAALEARLAGQMSFFEEDPDIADAASQVMAHQTFQEMHHEEKQNRQQQASFATVDLESVATSESRSLGPELVGHMMWNRLNIPTLLRGCGFSTNREALAEAVVLGRLISPSSDLDTWHWLRHRTALLEFLPTNLSQIGKNAIYTITDQLFAHKGELEGSLRKREAELFPSETTLFLFDLTNTYFEGKAENNGLAKRGKSKEKRSDCPLVTLALVVDVRGFPIFSQIYGGNQSEPETLTEILEHLESEGNTSLFDGGPPSIIMDRGIATKDNMDLLKVKNYPYIVVERRPVEKEYKDLFAEAKETFQRIGETEGPSLSTETTVTESVYVKKMPMEKGTRVLCLSEGRERKEMAMDNLKEQRFLHDLTRLQTSVEKGNIKQKEKVGERVGRLKERYPSIARYYEIALSLDDKEQQVTTITFQKKPTRSERSALTGCYVIETSHETLSAEEIWKLYTTLTRVENAFRSLKTDLGVRPVYHQLAERTKAHLFISVLAYHLLISIEYELAKNGDAREWGTIRKQLSTHQRTTVMLTDQEDHIHHVRVSGTPENVHNDIYNKLKVKDPLKKKRQYVAQRK